MGKASRDKGLRRERALVEIHRQSGIPAERVPLSGATHYRGNGADIDIYARGARMRSTSSASAARLMPIPGAK
jgi:Holliday junction resolvase